MKPTLFVLAAGMGSRYGGLKQLDGLGPNGETIMDYSIFDAIRGGFGKIVFVIRKGSLITSLPMRTAWLVPQGLARSSGQVNPSGRSVIAWNTSSVGI